MDKTDVTFIVHQEWLTAISGLPLAQQDAVIAEFIRYGAELPPQHEDDANIVAMVNLLKGKIDYSKDKYAQKVAGGKNSGKKKKFTDKMIYDVAQEHLDDAQAVADILGCSKSTVDHSDGWRRRKEQDVVFLD